MCTCSIFKILLFFAVWIYQPSGYNNFIDHIIFIRALQVSVHLYSFFRICMTVSDLISFKSKKGNCTLTMSKCHLDSSTNHFLFFLILKGEKKISSKMIYSFYTKNLTLIFAKYFDNFLLLILLFIPADYHHVPNLWLPIAAN